MPYWPPPLHIPWTCQALRLFLRHFWVWPHPYSLPYHLRVGCLPQKCLEEASPYLHLYWSKQVLPPPHKGLDWSMEMRFIIGFLTRMTKGNLHNESVNLPVPILGSSIREGPGLFDQFDPPGKLYECWTSWTTGWYSIILMLLSVVYLKQHWLLWLVGKAKESDFWFWLFI